MRLTDEVSNLFQVTVSGPGGAMWKILVRAVDAESAAGAVRARGHQVVGVRLAEKPRSRPATPPLSCVNCGYSLLNLPAGDAGEVMCPECGRINTPDLPASASTFAEFKRQRREYKRPVGCTVFSLFLLIAVVIVGALVRWIGRSLNLWP
ncbi:MAG TPA: hypothetical protein VHC70_06645 [Phycisphaerales bacterium]|nr:hypothetical protein [Phycisphaerales bacterium]